MNKTNFLNKTGVIIMEFELDKVEEYTTSQLQKFLDEIEEYWVKTNELHSMTDLLEINRELTLREYFQQ
tara:strand:+ start:178 stop:384 length:207 start_codon:yes stop_codon:yes gene_type:complete